MSLKTSSPEKKRARKTPRTPSINHQVGLLHSSPETEGSLETLPSRKVTKIKKEDLYSHIVEEAYIFDPEEQEGDPYQVIAKKQKDDTPNKKPPVVLLTGDDKSQINDLL